MFDDNLILLSDSYKVSHHKQYPPETQTVYSYFESRGGEFPYTIFFGLQYYLYKYLKGCRLSGIDIEEAERYFEKHFGNKSLFNKAGWEYICDVHNGKLPVSIKAIPEGTRVSTSNVLMTIENTDPKCYWLTNYLETLLVQTWYGSTVATQSYAIRQMITKFLEETGDPSLINFKLHDFGFRGVSSVESAAIGGAAHLINFMGTDTMVALKLINEYYNTSNSNKIVGHSIPAAEHSTICSWGREYERDAFENMLDQYPEGLVACVSDSYNIFNACEKLWGSDLKDKIMARNGTLVIRPDSGDPVETILKVLHILEKQFSCSTNAKGYKVLDPHVRIIQGDGVNINSIEDILREMKTHKFSADNIAFGMGGALLQKLHRDTQSFAFKCSGVKVGNEWKSVFKCPITDTGKISKAGRLKLIARENAAGGISYQTVNEDANVHGKDLLVEVFRDGKILKTYDFDEVRKNAAEINKDK